MTRITVITPNFNHARYLPVALEALLAQTRPADEVILIDDHSTDDSLAVIECYLPRFKSARLVRNPANIGVAANMNVGLQLAQGDAVVFVAADDIIYPNFFERAAALLDAFPQAAFASGRTDVIDFAGYRIGELRNVSPLDRAGFIDPRSAARYLSQEDAWFTGNVTLFRKAPVMTFGGFPEELSAFTDGFVSRVLAVTHGACYAPEVWGAWRRMEGGFAWSLAEDDELTTRLANLGERRLCDSGAPFEPGYPRRWRGRFVFGTRRFALGVQRRRARSRGLVQYGIALAREAAMTGWLFLSLRPRDLVSVMRRRLSGAGSAH